MFTRSCRLHVFKQMLCKMLYSCIAFIKEMKLLIQQCKLNLFQGKLITVNQIYIDIYIERITKLQTSHSTTFCLP